MLVVTGPIGAGKSTVVGEIGEILGRAGISHTTCDFDALTQFWPPPPDDRFNVRLGQRILACLWEHCRSAGAGRLVLAMTVETEVERRAVDVAVPGADPVFIRLSASMDELTRRIRARELGSAAAWHVQRAQELAIIMDANPFEDAVIDTDGRSVEEVARAALSAAGW